VLSHRHDAGGIVGPGIEPGRQRLWASENYQQFIPQNRTVSPRARIGSPRSRLGSVDSPIVLRSIPKVNDIISNWTLGFWRWFLLPILQAYRVFAFQGLINKTVDRILPNMATPFTQQVRELILKSDLTGYWLHKKSGLSQSRIAAFLKGGELKSHNFDRLLAALPATLKQELTAYFQPAK